MRKPVQVVLVSLVVVLAIAAAVLFAQYQKTSSELRSTQSARESAEGKYAKTIDDIAEIQDSLNAISLGDTSISRLPWNPEPGQKMSRADERQALDRIALLRASIARNKERIVSLETGLKKSGAQVAGLRKLVNNLKQSVAEKEEMVATLTSRVDELQGQVTGLTETVAQTQDTLRVRTQDVENKRRELATIYYIVGDKRSLKQAGVVESKGGVLGLGKTLQPSPSASITAFTPLDTDQETVISTSSNKARLISSQPVGSYQWVLSVDGRMELHIVDPAAFRKIREVVILTS